MSFVDGSSCSLLCWRLLRVSKGSGPGPLRTPSAIDPSATVRDHPRIGSFATHVPLNARSTWYR